MDDNNQNQEKNQSNPIFETVPIDEQNVTANSPSEPQIEETPDEVVSPVEENISDQSTDSPPPVYLENKNQYLIFVIAAIIFFLIFILIIKSIFSGISKPKAVTLTYWGLWEDKRTVQPLIDLYQQKYPNVKINYQQMSPENYRDKLIVRSKDGSGPDIFRFHNTWLPQLTEVVAPLPSQIMSAQEFEKTFYKVHQKDLKVGNYYYGLPLMIDGLVLVYNDDLFKKAGITTVPNTWEDIADIVPKLTVKDTSGNIITSGIALGTANNIEHFSDILGLLFLQNGVDLHQLDSNEAAEALAMYRRFAEPPNNYWSEDMPNSLNAFIQGKVAMIFVPSWQILSIKAVNPDIKIKVVPVPAVPGGKPISLANYWVEGVSKYSKNQIEAWKFLKFLTEKENLTKLYELQAKERLFGEPYSRVDLANLLVQNEYIGAVIKQADNFVSLPLVSRTFDNGLNDQIIKYLENAVNSTIQGVSYNEALKTAQEGVKQVFTKYKL
ncbi:MAG: ABC transporter substrate-binding protein [Microgenomates group bacterium]